MCICIYNIKIKNCYLFMYVDLNNDAEFLKKSTRMDKFFVKDRTYSVLNKAKPFTN